MISIEAWRRVIGGFAHPRSARFKSTTFKKPCSHYQDYTLCCRLVVTGSTLWFLLLTHYVIGSGLDHVSCLQTNSVFDPVLDCTISNSFGITNVCTSFGLDSTQKSLFKFSNLLLSGDIETNPGPPFTLEDLSVKFDDLQSEIRDLRKDITKLSNDMQDLRYDTDTCKNDIDDCFKFCNETSTRQKDDYKELHEYCERQEIYSRRENIIFKNIDEDESEDVGDKVIKLLNSVDTESAWKKEQLQRVHRLGRKVGDRSRVIIARFISFQDKLKVIGLRQKLIDKNVKVTNDLTRQQRQTLSDLNHRGITAYYKGSRLITHQNNNRNDAVDRDTVSDNNKARDFNSQHDRYGRHSDRESGRLDGYAAAARRGRYQHRRGGSVYHGYQFNEPRSRSWSVDESRVRGDRFAHSGGGNGSSGARGGGGGGGIRGGSGGARGGGARGGDGGRGGGGDGGGGGAHGDRAARSGGGARGGGGGARGGGGGARGGGGGGARGFDDSLGSVGNGAYCDDGQHNDDHRGAHGSSGGDSGSHGSGGASCGLGNAHHSDGQQRR